MKTILMKLCFAERPFRLGGAVLCLRVFVFLFFAIHIGGVGTWFGMVLVFGCFFPFFCCEVLRLFCCVCFVAWSVFFFFLSFLPGG